MRKPLALIAVLGFVAGGVTAPAASAQESEPIASVRSGSCLAPDDDGASLGSAGFAETTGDAGAPPSVVVTVPRPLSDLGDERHHVVIETRTGTEARTVACGDIDSGGEGVIPLRASGLTDPVGVAWLTGAGDDGSLVRIALTSPMAAVVVDEPSDAPCAEHHAVELGRRLAYAGWEVRVDGATFDPESGQLAIDVRITNMTRRGDLSGRNIGLTFIEWDERIVPLSLDEETTFIAGQPVRGRLHNASGARFPESFSFCDATLTIGRPTEYQTSVVMRPDAVAREAVPRPIDVSGTARLRGLDVRVRLRGSSLVPAECGVRQGRAYVKGPLETDSISLVLDVTESIGRVTGSISKSVISPDGAEWPIETHRVNGPMRRERQYCVVVPAPAVGRYVLVIDGGRRKGRATFRITPHGTSADRQASD